MIAPLLLALLLAAPPVAGRPADFSGAVGGPFRVEYVLDPPTLSVEQAGRLTLTIRGDGDLTGVRPPAISWPAGLVADPLDAPPGEFRYRVRAARPGAFTVPRYKFVYYQPTLRAWQTTYAEPVTLTVEAVSSPLVVPPAVREWAREVRTRPTSSEITRAADAVLDRADTTAAHLLCWQALRADPTDADAARGLALLRAEAGTPGDPALATEVAPETVWYPGVLFRPAVTMLAVAAWCGIAICLVRGRTALRWAGLAILLPVSTIPAFNLLVSSMRDAHDHAAPFAVVARPTELRSGNGPAYPAILQLPRGTECRTLFRRGDWWQIELPAGRVGWIPADFLCTGGTE
ncbi:MAG: SH3 domain-containing protein [Gemmataceae bacterium]|nr:SH3 domain-containing protein [Gemmataceae bacterium]